MKAKNNRTERITVMVSQEEKEAIENSASDCSLTASAFIRFILLEAINKKK